MPRRAKTQQAPQAAPGQAYGENQDQIQAQHIIPLPDNLATPAPSAQAPQATTAGPVAGHGPVPTETDPIAALMAAAKGTPAPGPPINAPTDRPDEPLTAGVGSGPGPGAPPPGTVSKAQAQNVADTYLMLAQITGNQGYRTLAANALRQGV